MGRDNMEVCQTMCAQAHTYSHPYTDTSEHTRVGVSEVSSGILELERVLGFMSKEPFTKELRACPPCTRRFGNLWGAWMWLGLGA